MTSLWDEHPRHVVALPDPFEIRQADAAAALAKTREIRPAAIEVNTLGRSAEGREVLMAVVGAGPRKVLAWTQMHGDEPTHTAVLLDLIRFLLASPDHPAAASILAGCSLHAVLILNPDGAERRIRENAQGIDINRDALALASPEANLLRKAVETVRPDFALNLHNHNPRVTAGDTPEPAAVALLAPPIDQQGSMTSSIRTAEKMASCFCAAVAPYAGGRVARYRAEYMPRAFGEWIQGQGIATLLIEAGGWSELDATPLRQIHFCGLAALLADIAADGCQSAEATIYRELPLTGEQELFDLLIRGASIVNADGRSPCKAELGVNSPSRKLQSAATLHDASIVEIGDLRQRRGKAEVEAADAICRPGNACFDASVTPRKLPAADAVKDFLQKGVTTVIGLVDLTSTADLNAWERLPRRLPLPLNVGFVAWSSQELADVSEHLARTAKCGPVGLLLDGAGAKLSAPAALSRIPAVSRSRLDQDPLARILTLDGRQAVELGGAVDLLLCRGDCALPSIAEREPANLQRVLVGGNVVFESGTVIPLQVGTLIARSGICDLGGRT